MKEESILHVGDDKMRLAYNKLLTARFPNTSEWKGRFQSKGNGR
jgi:hypothetical protein